jgi:small basic protein (TIGR04137 family)
MSIHHSLVSAGKLRRHRNVLTRSERLDVLKKEERWKEDQSIFGLPKVRNIMLKAKKKKEEVAAEGAEGAPATGAVPAAGATPAAPGAKGGAPAAAGKAATGAKGAAPAAAPAKGAAPAKKEEKKK